MLEFGANRTYLTIDSYTVDDDALGASHGDGDGIIEYDETIELDVALRNMGHLAGTGIVGDLGVGSAYAGVVTGRVDFGTIPAGGTVMSAEPFVFHVTRDVPDGELLAFDLLVNAAPGALPLELEAHAPVYIVDLVEIDDLAGGNGNGIAEPGETVALTLLIGNQGSCDSPEVTGELQSGSQYLVADPGLHALGVIAAGQAFAEGGFTVTVDPGCPPGYANELRLVLAGPGYYFAAASFRMNVGQVFADDMEAGAGTWTHYPGGTYWRDEWHLETFRNHTYAGQTSWKCGGPGNGHYSNNNYAILQTAPIDLFPGARLEFWHWMRAEVSAVYPGYCFDGGQLQISTDGGASWVALEPEGGYPYRIRAASGMGPFPGETPLWSGEHGWTEVWVDLGGYEGEALLRWVFGSSAAIELEGWYVDDVRIVVPAMSDAPAVSERIFRPVLFPVAPNPCPASGLASVRFALPAEAQGSVAVFDASGRLVRSLAGGTLAAGEHRLTWDGRDQAGRPAAAGSYYCRLAAGRERRTQRISLVR